MTHNQKKFTSFIGLSKTYVVNQSSNCLNFTHLIERFKERERESDVNSMFFLFCFILAMCIAGKFTHLADDCVTSMFRKACLHKHASALHLRNNFKLMLASCLTYIVNV